MKGTAVGAIILIVGLSSCASVKGSAKGTVHHEDEQHKSQTTAPIAAPQQAEGLTANIGVTAHYNEPHHPQTVGSIHLRLEDTIKLPIDERVYHFHLEDADGLVLTEKELDWLTGLGRASYNDYGAPAGVTYIYNIPITVDEKIASFPLRLTVTDPHRVKKVILITKF